MTVCRFAVGNLRGGWSNTVHTATTAKGCSEAAVQREQRLLALVETQTHQPPDATADANSGTTTTDTLAAASATPNDAFSFPPPK